MGPRRFWVATMLLCCLFLAVQVQSDEISEPLTFDPVPQDHHEERNFGLIRQALDVIDDRLGRRVTDLETKLARGLSPIESALAGLSSKVEAINLKLQLLDSISLSTEAIRSGTGEVLQTIKAIGRNVVVHSGPEAAGDLKDGVAALKDVPQQDSRLNLTYHEDLKSFSCHSDDPDLIPTQLQIIPCENSLDCQLQLNNTFSCQYQHGEKISDCTSDQPANVISKPVQETIPTAGIAICRAEQGRKYQYLEYLTATDDSGKSIIVSPGPATPAESVMSVYIWGWFSDTKWYVNQTTELHCYGSAFLFSDDFRWAVKFEDGALYVPPPGLAEVTKSISNGYYHSEWKVKVASEEIVKYICMAPLLTSSGQWMNHSVAVSVHKDGHIPVILEEQSSKSNVTVFHDEENVRIHCVANARPTPRWSWHKDNMELDQEDLNAEAAFIPNLEDFDLSETYILFKKVGTQGENIAGTYYCNATNPTGTTVHEIVVSVEQRILG